MGEYLPRPEALPVAEWLLTEVDACITAEPNPVRQAYLYAAGLEGGDDRHLLDGTFFNALLELHTDGQFTDTHQSDVYTVLKQTAKGIGGLYRRGHDVIKPASQIERYAVVCGEGSDYHKMVGYTLLEARFVDPEGRLLSLYSADNFLSADTQFSPERRAYGAHQFLEALVAIHGVDVLAEDSPCKAICEGIWDMQGKDSDFYGLTFYLSDAYAQRGNTARALELAQGQYKEPNARIKALIKVAGTCVDPVLRQSIETDVIQLVQQDMHRLTDLPLRIAAYYVQRGLVDQAREWLAVPVYTQHRQADTWAQLYLHTGEVDDRFRAVEYWHEDFGPGQDQAELLTRVAIKDLEKGVLMASLIPTTVPLMAHELVTFDREEIAWNRGLALALLAEHFAATRNSEALNLVLTSMRNNHNVFNKVRGLAAASGLSRM